MRRYIYYKNCTNFTQQAAERSGGLIDMIAGAINITRATFIRHVDPDSLQEIESGLGYVHRPEKGMRMEDDCHVTYHRGKLNGRRVYYFWHSAIEYIFTN